MVAVSSCGTMLENDHQVHWSLIQMEVASAVQYSTIDPAVSNRLTSALLEERTMFKEHWCHLVQLHAVFIYIYILRVVTEFLSEYLGSDDCTLLTALITKVNLYAVFQLCHGLRDQLGEQDLIKPSHHNTHMLPANYL